MIQKTRAIVLHQLKYSETSIIATLYTEAFGRLPCMINGIRSSKSKQKIGLIQPLFLLEAEIYYKPGRDVQNLKEFCLGKVYHSIPFDVAKSTMAMFLSEVLYKVLRNEEPDPVLFEFILHSVYYFDSMENGAANFHLWFLVKLLDFLGFRIDNNTNNGSWFNMKAGSYTLFRPSLPNTPDLEESALLADLIDKNADNFHQLSISGNKRTRLLEILIDYYSLHIDGMGTINSLKVMKEIYH